MAIAFRCRCGSLQGEVEPAQAYARAICYCRDCQAGARALGDPSRVLDAKGGTDIIATRPFALRFTSGAGQLACLSLSPRGLLRWHAACCGTPIANTPRSPRLAYAGLVTAILEAPAGDIDAAFGPARTVLNAESATGDVRGTPLLAFIGILRILRGLAAARLGGGHRRNPFFQLGVPVRAPRVLSLEERESAEGAQC